MKGLIYLAVGLWVGWQARKYVDSGIGDRMFSEETETETTRLGSLPVRDLHLVKSSAPATIRDLTSMSIK